MSVRLDAVGEYLSKTTGLLDYNSPYTIMLWVYRLNLTNNTWYVMLSDAGTSNYDLLAFAPNNDKFQIAAAISGVTGGTTQGEVISNTTWYHLAMVRTDASTLLMYQDGALAVTHTKDITGRAAHTRMEIGYYNEANNTRIAHIKAWTAALSEAEVAAEMRAVRPLRWDSLWGWWPLIQGV